MNLVILKLILLLVCVLGICKTLTTPENVNPFAVEKEISVDKDKYLSMENVIKFEKWMVINSE